MLAALLLALAIPAQAQLLPQNWKPLVVDKWGGLNLLNDSTTIGEDCQYCQNVLTDNGYLEKRPGNVLLATFLAGSRTAFVDEWTAPTGTRYLIGQASTTIYYTNFSGAAVALSTITAGYNLTSTSAFSKLYFSDGANPLWYWDGTSTGTIAGSPICTYTAFKDARLWCANQPSVGTSQVSISSQGGANYWTVPYNVAQIDNAPNTFSFNPDDGDYITCMAATPWGMFVGKRYSSYLVRGNGNLSYDPRILDPKIGCVDNRSVQMVYGVLQWLALDGVYAFDGSSAPKLISRELDPLMKQVRESIYSEGQWATQLRPDWASGTTSTTTGSTPAQSWDFSSLSGSIFPSSGTLYDSNRSPRLQGGVGFSSDTLVNVDTTTVPLSVGYAQIRPSTSGVTVWQSSFPTGNYSTMPTTWTVTAGSFNRALNQANSAAGVSLASIGVEGGTNGSTMYTTAPSSGSPPSASGWTFGYWTITWLPYITNSGGGGSVTYGRCSGSAGDQCLAFDFISDKNTTVSSAWSGYGINITQTNACSSNCAYSLALYRTTAGAKTSLGAYAFEVSPTSTYIGFSTFTVTRTLGGDFIVALGTQPVFSAHDSTSGSETATFSVLTLNSGSSAPNDWANCVSTIQLQGYGSSAIVSRIVDTGIVAPLAGVLSSTFTANNANGQASVAFYLRSSTSPNNDMWTAWSASSNGVVASMPRRYWQYEALFGTSVASDTPKLYSVQLDAVTTGYYYSKVDFVGSLITAWRQFAVSEDNPGTYGYAVRQATYAFAADSSLPWTAQSVNQNVNLSVSTPTYAQFRLSSVGLTSASSAEPITGVFLRWAQGANIPVASASLDRRYYLCVAISTTATVPDTCMVRQKNGKWVFWSGPSIGAMGLYNYNIVAADGGTSSKVWEIMQRGVYSDDGEPIDAYWISSDWTDGAQFNTKVLHEAWVDASAVAASSVTFSYAMDKSSTWVDKTVSLDASGAPASSSYPLVTPQNAVVNKWVSLASGYAKGKYMRLKFEDNTLGDYFRVNSYLLLYETLPRAVP